MCHIPFPLVRSFLLSDMFEFKDTQLIPAVLVYGVFRVSRVIRVISGFKIVLESAGCSRLLGLICKCRVFAIIKLCTKLKRG